MLLCRGAQVLKLTTIIDPFKLKMTDEKIILMMKCKCYCYDICGPNSAYLFISITPNLV